MWFWFIGSALAAAASIQPPIENKADAWYLWNTGRNEKAAAWFQSQAQAAPDDPLALMQHLRTMGWSPSKRTPVEGEVVAAWAAAHPDEPYDGALQALALGVAAMGPGRYTTAPLPEAGPWCTPAQAAVATLPEDPLARYYTLWVRVQLRDACGGDVAQAHDALNALARTGQIGAYRRAIAVGGTDIGQADLEAIGVALDEEPARLLNLLGALKDKATGDAVDDARALLIQRARALAGSDRPAVAYAAAVALDRAGLAQEAQAAAAHVVALDPDNHATAFLGRAHQKKDAEQQPEALTLLDPNARLEALGTKPPRKASRWDLDGWWIARIDSLTQLGRTDDALSALNHWWRVSYGTNANVRFAQAAAHAGRHLHAARRAAAIAVFWRQGATQSLAPRLDPTVAPRPDLADAYDARAAVFEAKGRLYRAQKDLESALLVASPTPARWIHLGLLYDQRDRPAAAHPLLGAGLAQAGDLDPALLARARTALSHSLDEAGVYVPGGVDVYLDGWRQHEQSRARPQADPRSTPALPFDLDQVQVEVDGQLRSLASFQGPLVIDVWATWCAPCRKSLPDLESLARAYHGQATFLAVSVDDDAARAAAWIKANGGATFTTAHASGGMSALGIRGIPATFVFDGEHHLVTRLSGWGPGDPALKRAVNQVLGGEP